MSVLVRILVQLRCSDYKKDRTPLQGNQNISGEKFLTERTRYSALTSITHRFVARTTTPHSNSSIWQNDFFVAQSRIPFLWRKDPSEE